ncbi:CxxxxCH/CxxCH domain-containing protein [uncultured Pseudophaeobacter sp.]
MAPSRCRNSRCISAGRQEADASLRPPWAPTLRTFCTNCNKNRESPNEP